MRVVCARRESRQLLRKGAYIFDSAGSLVAYYISPLRRWFTINNYSLLLRL